MKKNFGFIPFYSSMVWVLKPSPELNMTGRIETTVAFEVPEVSHLFLSGGSLCLGMSDSNVQLCPCAAIWVGSFLGSTFRWSLSSPWNTSPAFCPSLITIMPGSLQLGGGILQTFYGKISHLLFSCVAPAWCCEPLVRSKNILWVHFDDLFVWCQQS